MVKGAYLPFEEEDWPHLASATPIGAFHVVKSYHITTLERSIPLQRLGHVSLVVAGHAELGAVRDLHRANER